MVIWVTGLSGAGKTTLCLEILPRLKRRMAQVVFLDGDAVRTVVQDDLGFTEADRVVQIGRIQRFARLLSEQGLVVLVAALYTSKDLLAWNRATFNPYLEVLVDTPLNVVEARDPKGIYAKARAGVSRNVVGLDIPFHRPEAPDYVCAPATLEAAAVAAEAIVAMVLNRWRETGPNVGA